MNKFLFSFLVLMGAMVLPLACVNDNKPTSPSPSSGNTPAPTSQPQITQSLTPTSHATSSTTPTATQATTSTITPITSITPTPSTYNQAVSFGSGDFMKPVGIRYDGTGNLWVVDMVNGNLTEWTTAGGGPEKNITTFNGEATFKDPGGVGIDPQNGNIYVADEAGLQIEVFTSAGAFVTIFGTAQLGSDNPVGVAVNSQGTTVYVTDFTANLNYIYFIGGTALNPTYTYQASFGALENFNGPYNLFVDTSNNVYVADYMNSRVVKYGPSCVFQAAVTLVTLMTEGVSTPGAPTDVAVDSSGYIFVSDDNNTVIQEFDASGTPVGQWGAGFLVMPEGLTLDAADNIYVADSDNQLIVELKK